SEQKEYYITQEFLKSPEMEKWASDIKPKLDAQIKNYGDEPTQEKYDQLEAPWRVNYQSMKFAIEEKYLRYLKRLQEVFSKYSHSQAFEKRVKEEIEAKIDDATKLIKTREEMNTLISVELPKKLKKDSVKNTIPEEFIDQITLLPMENPLTDSS